MLCCAVLCNGCDAGEGVYQQSNGDTYEGEYHLDRKHGFGKFSSATEGVYEVMGGGGAGGRRGGRRRGGSVAVLCMGKYMLLGWVRVGGYAKVDWLSASMAQLVALLCCCDFT